MDVKPIPMPGAKDFKFTKGAENNTSAALKTKEEVAAAYAPRDPEGFKKQFGKDVYDSMCALAGRDVRCPGKLGAVTWPPHDVIKRAAGFSSAMDVQPIPMPGKDGQFDDNVAELAATIKKKVAEARADGTMGMSKRNLKALVSSRGFPNANAFERGFEEALQKAGVGKFIYG
jgi:hypothetical protein